MRALIVSLGSIGRRHLANLRHLEPSADITVWRRGGEAPPEADRVVHDLDKALAARPEAALLAGPAAYHIPVATELANHGIHLLIEKPLSDSLDGVAELIDVCRRRSLVAMVGYNWRFYAPFRVVREALREGRIGRVLSVRAEVGQYLPDWRPDSDYRQGVTARRELGGGVVLELTHEIDYVRWLTGEIDSVCALSGRLSDLEIDVEDTAEILLRFVAGAIGSVHLDMVRRDASRSCHWLGTDGTITWDGSSHAVRLYAAGTRTWSELCPAAALERNEMFLAEMRHFLQCVRRSEEPAVSLAEGLRVLEVALAARQSARDGRVIPLGSPGASEPSVSTRMPGN